VERDSRDSLGAGTSAVVVVAPSVTSVTGLATSPVSAARRRIDATSVTVLDTLPGTAARMKTPATTVTRLATL